MTRTRWTAVAVVATGAVAAMLLGMEHAKATGTETATTTRGQYLVTIMDCAGCHTPGALAGRPDPDRQLAGSDVGFRIKGVGVVYPKNLTPDADTGLGRWTDEEIVRAIRHGVSRDGRPLIPIMPWPSYSALTETDAHAIVAFLRTVKPQRFEVPGNAREGERAPAPYLDLVEPR